jgi:valyl-tRNA synthetase
MNLSTKKVEANRNFANKIWNAGRFILGALENAPDAPLAAPEWTLADSWIYARLQGVVREVERLFGSYQYGEAGRQIYDFFWGEFADWYLEIAKYQLAQGGDRAFYTAQTLSRVLDTCLRMLHPFTPFITEELWGHLKRTCQARSEHYAPKQGWEEALIIAHWPEQRAPEGWEDQKIADFALVQDVVRAIRNLRSEKKVAPSKRIPAILAAGEKLEVLRSQAQTILSLAGVEPNAFELVARLAEKPQNAISLVASGIEIYVPLAGLVDAGAEKVRLAKELSDTESQISRLDALVNGPFGQKAPAAVVDKERQKLATYQETAGKLRSQLQDLE